MQINWKRILALAGIILIAGGVGTLLYFLLLRPTLLPTQPAATNQPTTTTGGVGLQPAGTGGSIPLQPGTTTDPTQDPLAPIDDDSTTEPPASEIARGGRTVATTLVPEATLGLQLKPSTNELVYYNQDDDYFYSLSASGATQRLADKKFFGVESVVWSSDRTQAVIEYPDGANILYNFSSKSQITLPNHWREFSFSPDGRKVAFKSIGTTRDTRWVAVTNSNGSESRVIRTLGDDPGKFSINWSPNGQIVATQAETVNGQTENIAFVSSGQETFPLATVEGHDFRGLWSPSGDRLMYSTYSASSNNYPVLSIMSTGPNTVGQNQRSLLLNTWVEKCGFASNDVAYCAVPRTLPANAGLFREEFIDVENDIYRIDLSNGFRSLVATPDQAQGIRQLSVSSDERFLYYTGIQDNNIYQIRLR